MLTVQILTLNNEKTIQKCLESVLSLKPEILVVDQGSTDNTVAICEKFHCKVEINSNIKNYSELRNSLIKNNWNLMIHPYEFIATGIDELKDIIKTNINKSFNLKIAQRTTIIREIRLWNKNIKFTNPVYETIKDTAADIDCFVYSTGGKVDFNNYLKIIEEWKESNPLSPDPYYYQAYLALQKKEYKNFENLANYYFFKDAKSMSSIMLRYYLAMIQTYELEELDRATRNILHCIAIKPIMAEFWCLLGDIHYAAKLYNKAIHFYENAIILGSQRVDSDDWPIDVAKYETYPKSILESIDKISKDLKIYRGL